MIEPDEPTVVVDTREPRPGSPRIPVPVPLWARGPLPELGARMRRFTRTSGPAMVVLACALAACTSASAPPPARTARVERTTVNTAVASSGALSASTEQNLGFRQGGKVTAVDVKVGDRVTAGQVLATLDDGPLRRTLEQQQAQLDAQRAVLTRLINATTVQGAQNSVQQAQAVLSATEDQARQTREADDVTLQRAERQLDFDEDARDDAEDALTADQAACGQTTGSGSTTTGTFNRTSVPTVGGAMSALDGGATGASTGTGDDTSTEADQGSPASGGWHPRGHSTTGSTGTGGTSGPGTGTGTGGTGTGGTGTASTGSTDTGTFSALTAPVDPAGTAACGRVPSDQSAFAQADRQVVVSRTARDQARQQRDVDEAAGRLSIENARTQLVTAQNSLTSASTDRPSTIAQQQAVVDGAGAAVRQAQQDVDDTVLRAPVDGTISALNGAVGEYVESGSSTSATAPGSGAAIPGIGGAAAASSNGVARPGGTQFIVLDGVDTFQVVVPFEESDAAQIAPNQNVDVTFDAVPDLVRHGTVLAVAPAATSNSNVVSYYVTVVLTETDPRLRDGQTAQAAVHTTEVRDVPAVPNAAVHRQGGQPTVTVVGFDGTQRTVPIQTGVVGDTLTQVVSGLTVGDEVVVPSNA